MLRRLADGPANIGHLAEPLTMTLAAASKHVKVLVRAGLVERSDAGWHHTCALNRDPLHAVRDWLDELDAAHSARGNAKRE
jgi:DNA-binding transcriptional ArsR family regulator